MFRKIKLLDQQIKKTNLPVVLHKKSITRYANPISPFKSRMLGYKAGPAYFCVIGSIKKGGIEPQVPARGRTPSNIYKRFSRNISKKQILAQRIRKLYKPCKVLGGYFLCETGSRKWFEYVLKDPHL